MMDTKRHDDGKKGFVEAFEDEKSSGKMTFTWAGETKIIIDHTEVNPDFAGKGVGKKMLMNLVSFARERKIKIMPLCPFAASVFIIVESIAVVLW